MPQHTLSHELIELLKGHGASVVGFADLSPVPGEVRGDLPRGISIAVTLDPRIVAGITEGPTPLYAGEYERVNKALNDLAMMGAEYLTDQGYHSIAQDATAHTIDRATLSVPLPHKTVATLSGLGWIGKCALLITEEFGPAVRLNSIFTDTPLPVGEPVVESRCGECNICRETCPGSAPSGELWSQGMSRADFFDAFACARTARSKSEAIEYPGFICGMCMAACPYTKRWLTNRL